MPIPEPTATIPGQSNITQIKNGKLTFILDEAGNRFQLLPETSADQVETREALTIKFDRSTVTNQTSFQTFFKRTYTKNVKLTTLLTNLFGGILDGSVAANISVEPITATDSSGIAHTLDTTLGLQNALEEIYKRAVKGGVETVKGENETGNGRTGNVMISAEDIGVISYKKEQTTLTPDDKKQARKNLDLSDSENKIPMEYLHANEEGGVVTLIKSTTSEGSDEPAGQLRIPSEYLPAYVDDILEGYADEYHTIDGADVLEDEGGEDSKHQSGDTFVTTFYKDAAKTDPYVAAAGKIYVNLLTNKTYRWSGSRYTIISDSIAIGETAGTAYDGAKGKKVTDDLATLKDKVDGLETSNDSRFEKIETLIGETELADGDKDLVTRISENADGIKTNADAIADNEKAIEKNAEDIAGFTKESDYTPVTSAKKLETGREITISVNSGVDANGNPIKHEVTKTFTGEDDLKYEIELGSSGVGNSRNNIYSVVKVNAQGIVIGGGINLEVGKPGVTTPSDDLIVGGMFIEIDADDTLPNEEGPGDE